VLALSFAAYTHHAWEDYYITYRVSKNLATGHGLVYQVGERVHAFTSPFNVLIPALFSILTGNRSDELVLWLFRILSSGLLAGAAVMLLDIARGEALGLVPTAVLVGMFALDAKIVDFSINGQEVAFMMFFLALTLKTLTVPSSRTMVTLGLAWAGLMWTRPDGFIYLGTIAFGFLLFKPERSIAQSRLDLVKILVGAGALMCILYLPWFLWAWHYFGSPVPHTIIAKGTMFPPAAFAAGGASVVPALILKLVCFPFQMVTESTAAEALFLPTYAALGGWPDAAGFCGNGLAFVSSLYWLVPSSRSAARAASLALFLGLFYLSDVTPYVAPWYVPNCTILAVFVLAHIVQHALDLAARLKDSREWMLRHAGDSVRVLAVCAVAATCALTLCSAYEMRVQQREIEDGTRKQIGLWLRQNAASPADTVFLEPLGYIGYFSQLKMLDFPGLCALEVVAAERKLLSLHQMSNPALIRELRPDWLVLRPEPDAMMADIQQTDPLLLTQQYAAVKTFDASDRVASYPWLPGRSYLSVDQTFVVFRRNRDDASTGSGK
jgi:hypothetical protein